MAGYIERTLAPGETIRAQVRVHWGVYVPAIGAALFALFAWAFTLGGGMLGLSIEFPFRTLTFPALFFTAGALVAVGRAIIYQLNTEMAVTNKKVIGKWGLIARNTLEQRLGKVESITVDQGILGRVFNYGTVLVRGTGSTATPIRYIADPTTFRREIERAIEALEASQAAAPHERHSAE